MEGSCDSPRLMLAVLVSLVSAFDDADDCFVELPEHPASVPTSMAAAMMPAAICFAVVRSFIFPFLADDAICTTM